MNVGGRTINYLRYADSSSSLSPKSALRESGCRIDYEPTKMSPDHFWRSIYRDTNVEVSALSRYADDTILLAEE